MMSINSDALHGLFPALVTPFERTTGTVNEAALRQLIRRLLPQVDGFVVSGSTGEFPSLDRAERRRLLEIALEEANDKPVIAGCGAPSTREALLLTQDAQDAGAAAALIVLPYFLHPSDKGVYQHYADIAAQVELPLVLYNIPSLVGASLPRTVVEDLADLPQVIGLKDSSGDLGYFMELLEYVGDRIAVLCGHDEIALPALAAGANGMILGSAQVFPQVWQELRHQIAVGDLAGARVSLRSVQKLCRIFCRHGGGVAVKAALKMLGSDCGPPRAPLKAVGGALIHETRAEIQLELEKNGWLPPSEPLANFPDAPLEQRFCDLEIDPPTIAAQKLRIGTGNAGTGTERAQIDLIAGDKSSALGDAYALQLTYPLAGREALTTILEPALTVRPSTLLLPTLEQHNLRQANMIYGPTQSAMARAIVAALQSGQIPAESIDRDVMIALVTIPPAALDRHALAGNVQAAAEAALRQAWGD